MNLENKFLQLTEKHAELQLEYTRAVDANQSLLGKLSAQEKKNMQLSQEISRLSAELTQDRLLIEELRASKDLLSCELEDLTKNLFEEASGMVAKEAKRRNAIQIQQNALQKELEIARDLIATQHEELQQYRSQLRSDSKLNLEMSQFNQIENVPEYDAICGSMSNLCKNFCLYSKSEQSQDASKQFNGKISDMGAILNGSVDNLIVENETSLLCELPTSQFIISTQIGKISPSLKWKIFHSIDPFFYNDFVTFVNNPNEFYSKILKRLYHLEIEKTLLGNHKMLKTTEKKIFESFIHRNCSIELCTESWLNEQFFFYEQESHSPVTSATHSILNLFNSFVGNPVDDSASTRRSSSPKASIYSSDSEHDSANDNDSQKSAVERSFLCGICGKGYSSNNFKHRFKLSDSQLWLPLDIFCRERLVSVGNCVNFILNIKNSQFDKSAEPFCLFLRLLQLRRDMFYAKCSGSLFFRTSDMIFYK